MDLIDTFEASLEERNVTCAHVSSDEFGETLWEFVERPVVGTRLSGLSIELPEWVTTDPTTGQLTAAQTGVTAAAFGIADYGSVVLKSSPDGSEQMSLFLDRHVVVISVEDIVADMGAALERLGAGIRAERGSAVIATGPSATADMGSLVYGAHGPKTVHVLLVADDAADQPPHHEVAAE